VRVHRKLREAGVDAQLEVFEGMSHAQYQFDDRLPETKEAFGRSSLSWTSISAIDSWVGVAAALRFSWIRCRLV
jgi:acetyl esterase/lipase